jgi:hypothetical protein
MKVVINRCFGGFGISDTALARYNELADTKLETYHGMDRADPLLVQVVEELGKDADNVYSELKIVDIPDDIEWYIHEYDGLEAVYEKHRIWD